MTTKLKCLLMLQFALAIITAAPAFAANEGYLDDIWLKVEIKSKMTTVNWTSNVFTTVTFDSGKAATDVCWLQFRWKGSNSYKYNVRTICPVNGTYTVIGDQEQQEFLNNRVGSTYNWIELRDLATRNSSVFENELALNGAVFFTPTYNTRQQKLTKVSVTGSYLAYYLNRAANNFVDFTEGTGPASFTAKLTAKDLIPPGATALGHPAYAP